jgi:hypothetical protein
MSTVTRLLAWMMPCWLVLLAAGCGSPPTHSVREVERAFLAAGVPFESEQRPNPYLRPLNGPIWLPAPSAEQRAAMAAHVQAVLVSVNNKTFSSQTAYVYDSIKSAQEALRILPRSQWLTSNQPVTRAQVANVIVVAAPAGSSDQARRVRRAIAALQAG